MNAVAAAELDGRPVVISGSDDRTVRVWDLATGDPGRRPVHRPQRARARGGGGGAGRPPGGHLRQQRPDGAGVGPGHRRPRSAARSPATAGRCSQWRRRSWTAARWSSPAATTGRCGCGTWPPATPVGDPFTGHGGPVNAVAAAELDGRPVVISGSNDRTVRVWDLATGDPGRRPVHRPRRPGERGGGGGAGRPPGGHLRQRRPDGAGVGPGHRRPRSATRSPATATR